MKSYREQVSLWPAGGRHILAQFDENSLVVYQAYGPAIGRFAVEHQEFGGPFRFTRMSWIKPSFLWMMFRSGWGTKTGQEVILAIHLKRPAFDGMLRQGVDSRIGRARKESADTERAPPSVIYQWDPDHDPLGKKIERRTIQLGIRGDVLRSYARDDILVIEDISGLVARLRGDLRSGDLAGLVIPEEREYPVTDPGLATRLGLEHAF